MKRYRPSRIGSSILLLPFLALIGCSTPAKTAKSHPLPLHGSVGGKPIEHVVILAIDGLKRDTLLKYLEEASPKHGGGLHDLLGVQKAEKGVTFSQAVAVNQGVTVFPSYTYPAWTSLFTGVFPGAHGITGNSVFFRDRQTTRYYAEYHIDAVRVQFEENFFSNDINEKTKTIYEYVGEQGGESIVIHNMVYRGSEAKKPDVDTLLNYQKNRSREVDQNSLWETVKALQDFNADNHAAFQLPTVSTMYFSGLDHSEHLSPGDPENGRLTYLAYLDSLISKFIAGDEAVRRYHFDKPGGDAVQTDELRWGGLRQESVFERTLFVIASDHGHTPIDWNDSLGIQDLQYMFRELSERSGRTYRLEMPFLIKEGIFATIGNALELFEPGQITKQTNVVATLNGGALGLHIRSAIGTWEDRPDFNLDIKPVLEHVLLSLHVNDQGPDVVLHNTGNQYVVIPYEYVQSGDLTKTSIHLLPAQSLEQARIEASQYPMARRRLKGLATRLSTDPMSAPDIILLADRSKKLTYMNKLDERVIDSVDPEKHRHFHSDHGHLLASDSLVPIIFALGDRQGRKQPLATICEASVVEVTPTLLDVLGLLPTFERALRSYSDDVRGRSLKPLMDHIVNGENDHPNICPARMSVKE